MPSPIVTKDTFQGGANLANGFLANVVGELQGGKAIVLAGAAANTNIAVAGIKTTDTIASAIMFAAGVPSLVTVNITSAGFVQSTTSTAGNTILLQYRVNPLFA
jgi:hypothetical protein